MDLKQTAEPVLRDYDFIDFGCSKGGSIAFAKKAFKAKRGIGIDISPEKVAVARDAGFDAMLADARTLTAHPRAVSFVTMMDFLEHVPSVKDARTCIIAATTVARDFVFIRQPWFDTDGYLFSLGLKLFWSDWRGHPNAMTSLEIHNILSRHPNVERFRMYGSIPITSSADPAVHALTSPVDQHDWSAEIHPPKPHLHFDTPVYRQIVCIATLRGGSLAMEEIESKIRWDSVIFDSASDQATNL